MPPDRSATARSAHVRAKRERRREEILHAALRAFRERGYHATTLDHIAERLGVRKTALYHYFPDKESILHECHRESLAQLERILEESRALRSPRERLRFLIREHVRVMTDTLRGSPLAFEVQAFSEERRAEMISGRDAYERELRRTVERGVRAGEFRDVDPKLAVFAILGAINWIARWYRPEGELKAGAIGETFADHLMSGLGPAPRLALARGRRLQPRVAPRRRRPR